MKNTIGQFDIDTELSLSLAPTGRDKRDEESAEQDLRYYLDMISENDWPDFV